MNDSHHLLLTRKTWRRHKKKSKFHFEQKSSKKSLKNNRSTGLNSKIFEKFELNEPNLEFLIVNCPSRASCKILVQDDPL